MLPCGKQVADGPSYIRRVLCRGFQVFGSSLSIVSFAYHERESWIHAIHSLEIKEQAEPHFTAAASQASRAGISTEAWIFQRVRDGPIMPLSMPLCLNKSLLRAQSRESTSVALCNGQQTPRWTSKKYITKLEQENHTLSYNRVEGRSARRGGRRGHHPPGIVGPRLYVGPLRAKDDTGAFPEQFDLTRRHQPERGAVDRRVRRQHGRDRVVCLDPGRKL